MKVAQKISNRNDEPLTSLSVREERRIIAGQIARKYLPFLLVPINWSSMALI